MARTASKGSGILVKIALTALIIYLLYVFIGLQVKINAQKSENNELDVQISAQTTKKEQLTSILYAYVDNSYIEEVAREQGYVYADEKAYEAITD